MRYLWDDQDRLLKDSGSTNKFYRELAGLGVMCAATVFIFGQDYEAALLVVAAIFLVFKMAGD
jgi:hypothetical protein